MQRSLPAILAIVFASAACSAPRSGEPDGSSVADAGPADSGPTDAGPVDAGPPDAGPIPFPAPFPAPPQVQFEGGPVLADPVVIPIFYKSDTETSLQNEFVNFLSQVGSTPYWTAAVSEYGVGPVTVANTVVTTDTVANSISDTDVQTFLALHLNEADPAWPTPTNNSIYLIAYPAGVVINLATQGGTAQTCQEVGGYHSNIVLQNGTPVAYAVIPRCGNFAGFTGVNTLTATSSHEIVEAATDPYPQTNPAYADADNAHFYWELVLGGGEVGDMCAQNPGAFQEFPYLNYVVQRIWSNKAALKGTDPCQPELANEVYFNSPPVENDMFSISLGFGDTVTMSGINVAVGGSRTVDMDLFSEAATSGWSVQVQDGSVFTGGDASLTFSLTPMTGVNGDKLKLTINRIAAGQDNLAPFLVTSQMPIGNGQTQTNLWVGLVSNN